MTQKFGNMEEFSQIVAGLDDAHVRNVQIEGEATDAYKAVWNTQKNQLEGIVPASKSVFLTHKQAFGSLIHALQEKNIGVTGMVNNYGGRVVTTVLFDNLQFKDPTGSLINMGVTFDSNYSHARFQYPMFSAEGYGYRQKCENGMVWDKVGVGKFNGRFEKIADLEKKGLQLILRIFEKAEHVESVIATAAADLFGDIEDLREAIYGQIPSKKLTRQLEETLEVEQSLSRYSLYNAFTQHATRNAETEAYRNKLQRVAQRILTTKVEDLPRVIIPSKRK